jgi:uncharacterized protein YeaO (DUF488 family)
MPTRRPDIRIARVYDEPQDGDGTRVLVDRLWPRGVRKDRAAVAEWCRAVAPSSELRTWYGHEPARFAEFTRRYRAELHRPEQAAALEHLRDLARQGTVTLVTATKRADISQAAVLAELLRERG